MIKVTNIEDVYLFFHLYIKELKYKEETNVYLDNGGVIDHFIRKCLISFYKLGFEDFAKLYEAFVTIIDKYYREVITEARVLKSNYQI